MRKLILFSVFLLAASEIFAQQLPLFSQYMMSDYFENPAVAGSRPYFDVVSANRLQWLGITDAPRTYALSANGPIRPKNMGVGGYLFADITGPTRRIGMSGSYAYHVKINEKIKIALSLSAGVLQWATDGSKLTLGNSDPVFSYGSYKSEVVPDIGTSFYLYSKPKDNGTGNWWFGGYVPQIFPAKLNLFTSPVPQGKLATHFYLIGGYRIFLTDEFMAEPTFLVKYVAPSPMQIDVGARVFYKQKIWIGGAYRTNDAMSAMVGYLYKENLSIGYSYDMTTSGLKKYSSGTHELMIGLRFKAPAPAAPAPKAVD